jgi:3-hydroxybutyryl-CoA dehydrogenase
MLNPIRTVAVVGCGLMGKGIAEACASAGIRTLAFKATSGNVDGVWRRILGSMDRAVERGALTPAARERAESLLEVSTELDRIVEADLCIESVTENVNTKLELLQHLSELARADTVIASTTASLSLATLADAVHRSARFVGMHFFNPPTKTTLIEIGVLPGCDPRALNAVRAFCQSIGKTAVEVGDHPGYVVNRLLLGYILHAIETVEHGVAGPNAIDTAMQLGGGQTQGPLALADQIGLDVIFAVSRNLYQELADNRYRCPALLRRLVMAGSLGKKSGAGFYLYGGDKVRDNPAIYDLARPSNPLASPAPAA